MFVHNVSWISNNQTIWSWVGTFRSTCESLSILSVKAATCPILCKASCSIDCITWMLHAWILSFYMPTYKITCHYLLTFLHAHLHINILICWRHKMLTCFHFYLQWWISFLKSHESLQQKNKAIEAIATYASFNHRGVQRCGESVVFFMQPPLYSSLWLKYCLWVYWNQKHC